jgi:hypothetical protein
MECGKLEQMLVDRSAWASNPTTIKVLFLDGDELQFNPNHHVMSSCFGDIKRSIQQLRGIRPEQQELLPIPDGQIIQDGPELGTSDEHADDAGVVRLIPGQASLINVKKKQA